MHPVSAYRQEVEDCARFLAQRLDPRPQWAVVMGTGQKLLASQLEGRQSLVYEELPHFPRATSPSHRGRLSWGRLEGADVMVLEGRFHAYEGHTLRQVTLPVRVMAALGVKVLVLTNAAGGLNLTFRAGELMLISDHLNLMGDNPLVGENVDEWGPRFPDLSRVYDPDLMDLAEEVARQEGVRLRKGVYVAVKGPCLETPAETRWLRQMGADAVGMSTVPEAIVGVHTGMRLLGISVLSNLNLPDAMAPIALEDIIATVARAEPHLVQLVRGVLRRTGGIR